MRIFYAFLIIVVSAILFMLPLTEAIYDFRTAERTDTFTTGTGVAATTANVTLIVKLYEDDLGSVDVDSNLATDAPVGSTYNSTPRVLTVTGLTDNTTRTLEVTYDFAALTSNTAINTVLDLVPFIWLLIIIAFAPAAIFAIFTGKV